MYVARDGLPGRMTVDLPKFGSFNECTGTGALKAVPLQYGNSRKAWVIELGCASVCLATMTQRWQQDGNPANLTRHRGVMSNPSQMP